MRHRVAGRQLGRSSKHRKALRRNLISQLLEHGQIKTTVAKAKAIRGQTEKIITLARNRGDFERIIDLVEDNDEATLNRILTKAQAARLQRLHEAGDTDGLTQEATAIGVHARRVIARDIPDKDLLMHLFDEIAPSYWERPGGYTRIVRAGHRKGDNAEMAFIMLVEGDDD